MLVNLPSAIVRRGIFHSLRFELAFVLLFGVIAPVLALAFFEAGISHGLSRVMNWIGEPVVTLGAAHSIEWDESAVVGTAQRAVSPWLVVCCCC